MAVFAVVLLADLAVVFWLFLLLSLRPCWRLSFSCFCCCPFAVLLLSFACLACCFRKIVAPECQKCHRALLHRLVSLKKDDGPGSAEYLSMFVLSFLCFCCCLLAVLAVVFCLFLLLSFWPFGCCLLGFLLLSICRFAVVFCLFCLLFQKDCGSRVSKVSPDVTAPAGLP